MCGANFLADSLNYFSHKTDVFPALFTYSSDTFHSKHVFTHIYWLLF